jgi:hypothetical protein
VAQYDPKYLPMREWRSEDTPPVGGAFDRLLFVGGGPENHMTIREVPAGRHEWILPAAIPDDRAYSRNLREGDLLFPKNLTASTKIISIPYQRTRVLGTVWLSWAADHDYNKNTTGAMREAENLLRSQLGVSWCLLPQGHGYVLVDVRQEKPHHPECWSPVLTGDALRVAAGGFRWRSQVLRERQNTAASMYGKFPLTTLQWESEGGMVRNYRMMDFTRGAKMTDPTKTNGKYLCLGGPMHGTVRQARFAGSEMYELRGTEMLSHWWHKADSAEEIEAALQSLHNPYTRADTAMGIHRELETIIQSRYPSSCMHVDKRLFLRFYDTPAVVRLCNNTAPSVKECAEILQMMDEFKPPVIGGWDGPKRN